MKSTAKLARENNVKSLRLNNTDRNLWKLYDIYPRWFTRQSAWQWGNAKSHIKRLLEAENEGTLALEFFEHNPKAHAKKEIKSLPNETFQNIFKYIFRNFIF